MAPLFPVRSSPSLQFHRLRLPIEKNDLLNIKRLGDTAKELVKPASSLWHLAPISSGGENEGGLLKCFEFLRQPTILGGNPPTVRTVQNIHDNKKYVVPKTEAEINQNLFQ